MRIKLVYIGRALLGDKTSPRLWNVVLPRLEGYNPKLGYPTLGLEGLIEKGLLRPIK